MWYARGFETKKEAKKYAKETGGVVFSNKEDEYKLAAALTNFDTKKFPYIVRKPVR